MNNYSPQKEFQLHVDGISQTNRGKKMEVISSLYSAINYIYMFFNQKKHSSQVNAFWSNSII